MEISQIEFLEKRMKQIATLSVLFQFLAFIGAISILYFRPPDYKNIGSSFSLISLIASFTIARLYIHNGKKLEAIKRFSDEEAKELKREYFTKFFFAYGLWILFAGIFAYA